jgi:hypothetical protein
MSGVYFAKLVRLDNGEASPLIFVVRNDSSHSDILVQTSDPTWQAYNSYGGNSLYVGNPVGRAYKVSYNRPVNDFLSDFFSNEYNMLHWLEANGYDVSYFAGVDTDRNGALIAQHRVFMSVGHDEYWSGGQRANVEAARDAAVPVHLAFLSGNEVFEKTRWEASIDGTNTPYRTLVCYKESFANARIDPLDSGSSPTWTGFWRDPRFSPPADGGRPENALTGTISEVLHRSDPIIVPQADGRMRFWRNTSVAALGPGQVATLPAGVLGYEWDADLDNGFRPAGLIRLSTTTESVTGYLYFNPSPPPGNYYFGGNAAATHHLTMYRAPNGALVFGAGTIHWSAAVENNHGGFSGVLADPNAKQATVNLLADMGVQPATLQSGLTPATASTDTAPPRSAITSPPSGTKVTTGSSITISGTAVDSGGGVVGAVEISLDGGITWHPAMGRENWSYVFTTDNSGTLSVQSRAVDDSGNLEVPSPGITVTVNPATGSTPPTITTQPANQTVTAGQTVTFTAAATGSPTPTVQWQVSTDSGATFSILPGATSTTLSFATTLSQNGNQYQAVFTNSAGTATTKTATLTVNPATTKVPIQYEPENLMSSSVSSGPTYRAFAWSGFTDGNGTILDAAKVGDNVTITLNVPQAGTYDVKVAVKMYSSRGIMQLSVNGTNVGPAKDQYVSSSAWAEFDIGNLTFSSAGSQPFKFTVVGKNSASSGYSISFDYIKLTPQ